MKYTLLIIAVARRTWACSRCDGNYFSNMQRNLLSFGAISIVLLLGVIGNLAYGQRTPVPKTAAELFEALKLTEGQKPKFEALEEQRKQAQAKFKGLAGEALRKAQNDFYTERRKKLKEVFAAFDQNRDGTVDCHSP